MKLVRLPEEAFWQLASATRLKDKGLNMAKAVLVDGRAPAEVAAEFAAPRQYVHQSIQVVESAMQDMRELPHGAWLRGEVEIPVEIADDLEAVLLSIRDGRPGAVEAAAKALAKLRAWLTR